MIEQKITAWSFSRWNGYESCPKKTFFKVIQKMKEPSSPALERGTQLHLLCEQFLKGVIKRVPKELKLIESVLKDYKKRKAIPEAEFTFNRKWEVTGWFDLDAWCRVKADVTIPPVIGGEPVVEVHDFKSGQLPKDSSSYELQLELYAMAGLMTYPTAEKAITSLVYIDHGKVIQTEVEYTQKDVKPLQKLWEKRTKRMLNDTVFPPNPGNACRWCSFSRAKGGLCPY